MIYICKFQCHYFAVSVSSLRKRQAYNHDCDFTNYLEVSPGQLFSTHKRHVETSSIQCFTVKEEKSCVK